MENSQFMKKSRKKFNLSRKELKNQPAPWVVPTPTSTKFAKVTTGKAGLWHSERGPATPAVIVTKLFFFVTDVQGI